VSWGPAQSGAQGMRNAHQIETHAGRMQGSTAGGVGAEVREVADSDDALDRSWQERANCLGVDPDLFFPERGASTREAKEVCRGCEVRVDCLEYALANSEKFGIWGGMSERERRRIRRQRAQGRRPA
jgi:WhiB family transcriptional regulator, redox-sensing transcriptional regulator